MERLAETYRVIAHLTGQVRELTARVEEAVAEAGRLAERVEVLEQQAGKGSSRSSRPPSSDSPYKKPPRDRSLREKGKRAPGKQPGELGTTMKLVDDPHHRFFHPPSECGNCGTGLAGEEVFAQRRHQVTGIKPAPAPEVSDHVAQSNAGEALAGSWTVTRCPPGNRFDQDGAGAGPEPC